MANTKDALYSTAVAGISCAYFKTGDIVSVRFDRYDPAGMAWFEITRTEHGRLPTPIYYPKHHLKDFVI